MGDVGKDWTRKGQVRWFEVIKNDLIILGETKLWLFFKIISKYEAKALFVWGFFSDKLLFFLCFLLNLKEDGMMNMETQLTGGNLRR